MKISEALRSGAWGHKQIKGGFKDEEGGLCAIGAVAVGSGCDFHYEEIQEKFPETLRKVDSEWNVYSKIINMNDYEGKSFEEIAQWLEAQGL